MFTPERTELLSSPHFVVFASGRGSNFHSIYNSIQTGDIDGKIACVISDNAKASVLDKAKDFDLPAEHISPEGFEDNSAYVSLLIELLQELETDYILLAGYMKKIPSELIRVYRNQIVNIHPALLPSFGGKGYYGMRVHQAVIERGVKWSGVTVHFVDEIYDHGPIIYQYPVRVKDNESAEELAARVLKIEHKAYPKVVRWLSQGWIDVRNNKTIYSGPEEEWEIK